MEQNNQPPYVALFVDWDNLAISTAADLAGAAPDLKLIIQRAQEYGTIIVARAYAEWNVASERLSVYKAGIEPVYAPTFRFEPDVGSPAHRGKSLADPVMVTDCVDFLHLLPHIGVYVIVSGDKDLIPVVRLVKLRGKRVVVIGPDYAAGILREMADDFISYRRIVEGQEGKPAVEEAPRPAVAAVAEAVPRRRPGAPIPAARPPEMRPLPRPAPPPRPPERPLTERHAQTSPLEVPPEPEAAPAESLVAVQEVVVDILRQMAKDGKTKVRATNLKDKLLSRLPWFSERKYGFSKFKDFLLKAEEAGLLQVSLTGPVHWVSLPATAEEIPPTAPTEAAPPTPAPALAEAITPAADRRLATIRFISELKQRSTWFSYTFVLTNLISHLAQSMPQAQAEAEARATLNYLVAEGALKIDKDPQAVEVRGVTHRVRMCHLDEAHPIIREAMASAPQTVVASLEPVAGPEPGLATLEAAAPPPAPPEPATAPADEGSAEAIAAGEVRPEVPVPVGRSPEDRTPARAAGRRWRRARPKATPAPKSQEDTPPISVDAQAPPRPEAPLYAEHDSAPPPDLAKSAATEERPIAQVPEGQSPGQPAETSE